MVEVLAGTMCLILCILAVLAMQSAVRTRVSETFWVVFEWLLLLWILSTLVLILWRVL